MTKKKTTLAGNRPELDIDSMSIHGEIIKSILDTDDKASINIEIVGNNADVQAGMTLSSSHTFNTMSPESSKFNKAWRVPITRDFVLKLVAMLDNQAKFSSDLQSALTAVHEDAQGNIQFVRKEWGLRG